MLRSIGHADISVQCDLRKPGCSQCERAKLICHGYRDPNELIICDETHSTERKALASKPLAAAPTVLQLGWDVRARYTFFSYIFGLPWSYDVLVPLYEGASALGHLSASVDAVSLAFTSFQYENPSLMRLAKSRYIVAIQRVVQTLRSPDFTTDETLQSILLLDLYEKMVNRDIKSSVSWLSHVQGAMSLVKARGDRNFSSYAGRRLATRLAMTLTISSGAASVRVPEALVDIRDDLASSADHPKWSVTSLAIDVVNFKADYSSGLFASTSEVAERATELDRAFEKVEKMMPQSWLPLRIFSTRYNPLLFSSYYDVYQDHFVTHVWNVIRTMRLMLNNMIREHSSGNATNSVRNAMKAISEITEEICAAVPQFLLPGARHFNNISFSPLQSVQFYALLAPLYIAGQISTDQDLREWIIQTMEYMAETGRMKAAKDVADILRFTPDVDYWAVYAMLGSYAFAA